MAANRMMQDWRLRWAFPALGRVPTTWPWRMAHRIGRDPLAARLATERFLQDRFEQVFPQSSAQERARWACAHVDMLAVEMLDTVVLHRLGAHGGPIISADGWEEVHALQQSGRGFILVLNHYDRLAAVAIALARRGVRLGMLTMPVLENPGLGDVQRRFLMRKIRTLTDITRGPWRTTRESLRPVHEGLSQGQAWIILADAWAPEFGRLRAHRFLGGTLQLPTGIERLAQSTGAALVHGRAFSLAPDQLQVRLQVLGGNPATAIDTVIAQLERDVSEHPWAWWQWGLWEQMWKPTD